MAYETLIKRIIYVSTCDVCGDRVERTEDPPKERFCSKCNKWVPFVEESYTGPAIGGKK